MPPASSSAEDIRLAQIVEGSPIPTFVIDAQHRITHWNHALATTSGVAATQVLGTTMAWRAFYPEARPVLANLIIDAAGIDELIRLYGEHVRPSPLIEGAYECEGAFPLLTGKTHWFYFTAAPLRNADGQLVGAIETLQDISGRKAAETALQRHQDVLEERVRQRTAELLDANEELGQYAYAVSHDLRSPLRAIRNYADFLEEDLGDRLADEQRDYLNGIRQALQQGEELVADLLALSAIGRSSIMPQTVALGTFFTELIAGMALPANETVRLAGNWPTLVSERTLLGQVFRNLVSNALKFNRAAQKMVDIDWCEPAPGEIEIAVRDNGIGIEPRFFEQIFKVFHRLHTRHEFEGTGIGLAIVRKAAQHLNANVRVESTPGKGSTFTVTLPLRNLPPDS